MLAKLFWASLWLASSFSCFAQNTAIDSAVSRPIVILVTIDGFPARALHQSPPMPTLLSLAASGAVAEGMIPINPTVTWPNHTTLITGVDASHHHVVANGLLEPVPGSSKVLMKPEVDKSILVHGDTLYDIAARNGLTVGQVDWVAVAGVKNIAWQFEEKPALAGPIAQELIHDGSLTADDIGQFASKSPAWRDQVWTDAAVDILKKHTPDLLLVHLLETDTLQHRYGPLTPAAFAAYANADHCLARIVAAVHEAGLEKRVTYIIASDHGFSSLHHLVRPAVFLRQLPEMQDVWVKAEGGHADIFLKGADREQKAAQLAKELRAMPGVDQIYSNADAQRFGMPSTKETSQAPDLWITASQDYAFEDGDSGPLVSDTPTLGQHGYPNSNPEMNALFVASGSSIRPGSHLGTFPNLQVAPTIARILKLSLPEAQAQPLSQILR